MKEVELKHKEVHKEIREFGGWLTRNLRRRLSARAAGGGPKLVVHATLDPSGLRDEGGLLTPLWAGTAALDVAFRDENGAPVARMTTTAEPRAGQLPPSGDRLIDDVEAFLRP